jgi:hypothetical protein
MARNYWVVGATIQKVERFDDFIEQGLWFADSAQAAPRLPEIQVGDVLIMKKMLIRQGQIAVKGIGEVASIRHYEYGSEHPTLFRVRWASCDLLRPIGGFGATIHGPFPTSPFPIPEE